MFAGSVFDICVLEKGFHENVPMTAYCGNTSTPEKLLNGVEAYILCGWPNMFLWVAQQISCTGMS